MERQLPQPVELEIREDEARARIAGSDEEVESALVEEAVQLRVGAGAPEEVALFHDPRRGLLVVGDAVIGNPAGQLSLLNERVMDDPAQLRASVRRLLELDFDALLVGDGVAIRAGGHECLRQLVGSFPPD